MNLHPNEAFTRNPQGFHRSHLRLARPCHARIGTLHQPSTINHQPPASAFTLVEALLAMAITALVLVILFQVSGGVMNISRVSRGSLDAEQNMRNVMDSLQNDLTNSLNQYGYTVLVTSTTNSAPGLGLSASNTQLTFLTRSRGPVPSTSSTSYRCMAVSYWLNPPTGRLMRASCPIVWSDTNPLLTAAYTVGQMPTLTTSTTAGTTVMSDPNTSGTISATYPQVSSTVYTSVIAQGILRFETMVNLDNGMVAPLPQQLTSNPRIPQWPSLPSSPSQPPSPWLSGSVGGFPLPAATQALTLTSPPAIPTNPFVSSITVALAALDSQTARLPNALNIASTLSVPTNTVSQLGPNPPAGISGTMSGNSLVMSGTLPGQWTPYGIWSQVLLSGSIATSSQHFPAAAVAELRFVQNTFRLK